MQQGEVCFYVFPFDFRFLSVGIAVLMRLHPPLLFERLVLTFLYYRGCKPGEQGAMKPTVVMMIMKEILTFDGKSA